MSVHKNVIDINAISFNISINECFSNLKPHPKFASCTFDNYTPDKNFPSQNYIKNLLEETAYIMHQRYNINQKGLLKFLKKYNKPDKPHNIYIDGSYGIGKTHLLSAVYNIASIKKAFMSFSEINYFFHYLGVEKCIDEFSKLDLLLIDEFELDDPAMCMIMVRFFKEIGKNTLIITTSNTIPDELGKARFQTERFEKEIGIIAGSFKTVLVEGEDYRKKQTTWKNNISDKCFSELFESSLTNKETIANISFFDLMKILKSYHPFRYFMIPSACKTIFIDDLERFKDLGDALLFNHFIDHCYYYNTRFYIKSNCNLNDIFSKEMLESPFEKKLKRCLSRLDELSVFCGK